jgi:hypothetical protein
MREYSRRSLAGLFLAALFRPGRSDAFGPQTPQSSSPQSSSPQSSSPQSRVELRQYRADAAILFLGITILKRSGVGGGRASVERTNDGDSARTTLFFAAGSDPKRAHGLNRMGWIREVVLGSNAVPTEATYFGVMTSSPEESFAHAKKAIDGPQDGRSVYSAVNGRHTAGHSRSALTHFEFPADSVWSDQRLIDEARAQFKTNVDWRETSWPNLSSAPRTFLCELATLLKPSARHSAGRYIYNEQEYALELDAAPTGAGAARLIQVRGKIKNLRTGRQTLFQLWLEEGSDSVVPVRIDFQPRSFLRLTFEAEAPA